MIQEHFSKFGYRLDIFSLFLGGIAALLCPTKGDSAPENSQNRGENYQLTVFTPNKNDISSLDV